MRLLIAIFICLSMPVMGGVMFINSFRFGGGSVSTSYANTGGTGDRTAIITVTSNASYDTGTATTLVNGTKSENVLYFSNGVAASGKYIQFDFGSAKVINEAKWYESISASSGVWQWEGSADAMSWTAIGSTFTLGTPTGTTTHTYLSGNTTSYRYYRLLGVSGTTSYNAWLYEIEFKISS